MLEPDDDLWIGRNMSFY